MKKLRLKNSLGGIWTNEKNYFVLFRVVPWSLLFRFSSSIRALCAKCYKILAVHPITHLSQKNVLSLVCHKKTKREFHVHCTSKFFIFLRFGPNCERLRFCRGAGNGTRSTRMIYMGKHIKLYCFIRPDSFVKFPFLFAIPSKKLTFYLL